MEKLSYVYMMCSASRALYTGVGNSVYQRVWEHKNNRGGYFTSKYKCHRLVYYEEYGDILKAIEREKEIKGWRREKKNKLVESMNPTLERPGCGLVPDFLKRKVPPAYSPAGASAGSLDGRRDDEL